jgi:hypothetical protein
MSTTIAVVPDHDKRGGGWKILVNYIQRGVTFKSVAIANREATGISESEPCDHLILATEEA